MVETVHYDKYGNEIGSSSDSDGSALFVLVAICGVIVCIVSLFIWLVEKVNDWQLLELPYNYLAGFYYYTLFVPVSWLVEAIAWVGSQPFTKYPNLNIVITLFCIGVTFVAIFFILRYTINTLDRFGCGPKYLILLFMTPAAVGAFWFILAWLFNWLTIVQ